MQCESKCKLQNAAPPPAPGAYGGQAVAVLLNGDMMAFYECGFYGAQDTLFDYSGRHYFKDCRIQGSIDFIFGHAQSFYRVCTKKPLFAPISICD
jgi:pectinesterase